MSPELPSISGRELIRLLEQDGWENKRYANHGKSLAKYFPRANRIKVTVVPYSTRDLPQGTLSAILSTKQTGLLRRGLLRLIEHYS